MFFSALKVSGVDEVYFSSTTSCLYCPPKDLDDERIHSLAEEIFSYAEKRGKMILIHCDEVSVEIAKTFFHLYLEKYKDRIKVLEEYIKLAFEEVEEA